MDTATDDTKAEEVANSDMVAKSGEEGREEAPPPNDEFKKPAAEEDQEPLVEKEMAPEVEETGPEGVVVEELDRLKAENLNLRLMGVVNRETILQQQLNELGKERQELNVKMETMRKEIEAAYGINLQTHHINPDNGVVIPRNPAGGVSPQAVAAMQRLQQQAKG